MRSARAFVDDDVMHVEATIRRRRTWRQIDAELILANLQTLDKALPRLQKEARDEETGPLRWRPPRSCSTPVHPSSPRASTGTAEGALPPDRQAVPLRHRHCRRGSWRRGVRADRVGGVPRMPSSRPNWPSFPRMRGVFRTPPVRRPSAASMRSHGSAFATPSACRPLPERPEEARAWTIPKGATAREAAVVIHTDFQKGFIKAEVVSFDDLVTYGSMADAKSKGKVRIEGKEYVMADGDVVVPAQRVGTTRGHERSPCTQLAASRRRRVTPRRLSGGTHRQTSHRGLRRRVRRLVDGRRRDRLGRPGGVLLRQPRTVEGVRPRSSTR